ncbi:tRNA glutamyl-Q(34) synthetase GluQRS [Thalassotalea ganghwensis]
MNEADKNSAQRPYRGRFAPSPSGLLHFGSLITALASFLDAKANNGKWLVRIEDIDPPREQPGASKEILATLEAYGLAWDETVFYQSQQSERYRALLHRILKSHHAYYCQCTRAEIKAMGGIYQQICRHQLRSSHHAAIRLINDHGISQFDDIFQGHVSIDDAFANEDFIIHRKDGLFAYQLAVVADDIYQNITHVIRGSDLLAPTVRQLTLFNMLGAPSPQYGHIPLAVTPQGYKLSKQNKAPAIDNQRPQAALIAALDYLGQQPEQSMKEEPVYAIIQWAINNWSRSKVPNKPEITIE